MTDPTQNLPPEGHLLLADAHQWIVSGIQAYLSGDPEKLGDHVVNIIKAHDDQVKLAFFLLALFTYSATTFSQLCEVCGVDPQHMLDAESVEALKAYVSAIEDQNGETETPSP